MRVIVVASHKGGSGKTTLSAHLAVAAERAGAGPVVLLDIDPRGALIDWWESRPDHVPAFARSSAERLTNDLELLRRKGYRLAIVDTPPAASETISPVIGQAELVIVPTRGLSIPNVPGGAFWDPEADLAFLQSLTLDLRKDIPVITIEANINDQVFSDRVADEFLAMIAENRSQP